MGRQLMKKLNSRRGASMLLALVFLLLCVAVGTVVLTAASVSSGHVERVRREQQDYLAVSSAARLLEQDLAGLEFCGVYQRVTSSTVTVTTSVDEETGEETSSTSVSTSGPDYSRVDTSTGLNGASALMNAFAPDLGDAFFSTVKELSVTPPAEGSQTCPLAFVGDETQGIPAVDGTLTIITAALGQRAQFTIVATLWTTADGENSNTMTLVFRPEVSGPAAQSRTERTGGADSTTDTTTTTYTTTVTWQAPEITKGAAGG